MPNRQLTKEEETELNLRLNKNVGDWDNDLLANFDSAFLEEIGFDLNEFGISPAIDLTEEDIPEIPKEPKTKLGDVYKLGTHRLMCGDSTMIDSIEKLLNGKKVNLVFTDPPYGVSIGDKNKFLNKFQKSGRCTENIKNDTLSEAELYEVLKLVY